MNKSSEQISVNSFQCTRCDYKSLFETQLKVHIAQMQHQPPAKKRPIPNLIPIDQQPVPIINKGTRSVSPGNFIQIMSATERDYCTRMAASGQSALSDFASLIDDNMDDVENEEDNGSDPQDQERDEEVARFDEAGSSGFGGGDMFFGATDHRSVSGSPKSKTSETSVTSAASAGPGKRGSSFFDELKAKVDGTSNLTCDVCGHESKCLSEHMCHQRTHPQITKSVEKQLSAADLKSTRCQHCRKRCKTSAELVVHLNTVCRAAACKSGPKDEEAEIAKPASEPEVVIVAGEDACEEDEDCDDRNGDDVSQQQQSESAHHPMENKIFVWNTAVHTVHEERRDEDTASTAAAAVTAVASAPEVTVTVAAEPKQTPCRQQACRELFSTLMLRPHQQALRKEGKMYKTVSPKISDR